MTTESEYTLAELCIAAAAEAWRGEGETLATGIGLLPRLAVGLAVLTFSPDLMMSDSENMLVSEPIPVGPRKGYKPKFENWLPYDRVFSLLWSGNRHAMVGPVQVDRFGQTNISVIGDYKKPKAALLGVRGFPGNTASHPNSMFVPTHNTRSFVAGEVDVVAGIGYNPARFPKGYPKGLDLRMIVTDLAVMDFGGANHGIQVRSLHPGVTFEKVQENTGFPLLKAANMGTTPAPTAEQLKLIRERLDPHNLRATVFKDNPAGDRR